jgi:glycosyltransferase involved in cell wall biosynthesis
MAENDQTQWKKSSVSQDGASSLPCDAFERPQIEVQCQFQHIDRRLEEFQRQQSQLQEQLIQHLQNRETAYKQEIATHRKTCDDLSDRLTESALRLAELQNQLGIQKNESYALRTKLERWESIEGSRGFRYLKKFYSIRLKLIPRGSRREGLIKFGYKGTRRVLRSARARLYELRYKLLSRSPFAGSTDGANGRPTRRYLKTPALVEILEPAEVRGLVSVVLPVYNHAHMLKGAIESVLAQTYRNFELIVVNDGSTDGIEKVLAEYADHPQIRVLHQSNQKLPKALSNGFQFARGEFWTWTSADNLMLPEQLAKMVEYLQSHPETTMVYADYIAIDEHGGPLKDPTFRKHNRYRPGDPEIHLPHSTDLLCVVLDNFIGPCFLYRACAGRLLGEYDPSLGIEDYDYWMRMNMSFNINHLGSDRPLYKYRVHDDSLSGHARELGIYAKAEKLIVYQRERAAFFDKPWTIYADEATINWLQDADTAPHQVLPWNGESVEYDRDEKKMILVHAKSLPKVAASKPSAEIAVGAWFEEDAFAPYRYRQEIRRLKAVCFSREDTTLERLALMTERYFRMGSAASLLAQLVCFANNRGFMTATRTADELARSIPRPLVSSSRRTRVLLQAEQFTQGGLEQVVTDLAASLDRSRFDPLLLVLGEQGRAVEQVRERGIRILTLPQENREAAYRKMLLDERIDLVNAHFSIYGGYLAWQNSIPFVQTIHTSYVWLPPEAQEQYRANDQFTSAYLCVSQSVAQYSDLKLGLPPGKMIVIPNGIDLTRLEMEKDSSRPEKLRQELGISPTDFVFLNVAAIYAVKNQREMIHAFARIFPSCPEAKLVLLGRIIDEEYHAELERTIGQLGLTESVIFAGHHNDVAPFYRAANAFLLPSFVEGWSLSLTEAVSANLPVIATDVGGAADLLAQVGGKIIPPPYGSIANLTREAFDRHAETANPQFIEKLAEAMQSVYNERPRPLITEEARKKLSSQYTYKLYEQVFSWMAQGGHPDIARSWLTIPSTELKAAIKRAA